MARKKLVKEAQVDPEVQRLRDVVTSQIIPLLQPLSVEDSKMATQALFLGINQAFVNKQKDFIVKDLKIDEMIAPGDDHEVIRKLLAIVENESVLNAGKLLEKFPEFVDAAIRKEMRDRKLSDLPLGLV